jgi:hypothetical protein
VTGINWPDRDIRERRKSLHGEPSAVNGEEKG